MLMIVRPWSDQLAGSRSALDSLGPRLAPSDLGAAYHVHVSVIA